MCCDGLLDRLTPEGQAGRVSLGVRVRDRDLDVAAVTLLDARHRSDVHRGLLVGRRRRRRVVAALRLDVDVALGFCERARIHRDVRHCPALELSQHCCAGALGEDDGVGSATVGSCLSRYLNSCAVGASQVEEDSDRSLGDCLGVTAQLDVLFVTNLNHLLAHRDLAADVVEAGLEQLAAADVVRVAVLLAGLVEDQHSLVLETPLEADPESVLLARVADLRTLLEDDHTRVLDGLLLSLLAWHGLLVLLEEYLLGLLEDPLGRVRARRPDLELRRLAKLLLADVDVVVGHLPGDLGGAVDDHARLVGDVGVD